LLDATQASVDVELKKRLHVIWQDEADQLLL
jgi:hypothetical protein